MQSRTKIVLSIATLAVVWVAVQQLGLPDWVFYGAIVLLILGLPIILTTGHFERKRAQARATGTIIPPNECPSSVQSSTGNGCSDASRRMSYRPPGLATNRTSGVQSGRRRSRTTVGSVKGCEMRPPPPTWRAWARPCAPT